VSKRWLSVRDTYAVEVADGIDGSGALVILAAVLALDLAHQREERKERNEREDDRDDD